MRTLDDAEQAGASGVVYTTFAVVVEIKEAPSWLTKANGRPFEGRPLWILVKFCASGCSVSCDHHGGSEPVIHADLDLGDGAAVPQADRPTRRRLGAGGNSC
jgi:hypothetical protein